MIIGSFSLRYPDRLMDLRPKMCIRTPSNFEEMKKKISAAMEDYSLLKLGLEYGRWLWE